MGGLAPERARGGLSSDDARLEALGSGWLATGRAAFIIGVLTIVTPPLMLVQHILLRTWLDGARGLPHLYHRFIARLMGMRVRVTGAALEAGPCLIAANHSSWVDIVALSAVAPLSFVSKSEVAGWPIFGSFARLQRTVFVERERRSRTHHSRDEIQKRLALGDRLVLFPEGTSSDGNRVLPFKSALLGAANMVIDAKPVAVQPVTIAYTGRYGIPLDRSLRPAFTWYGDMELAPHLWALLKLGPFEVDVVLHDALDIASCDGRKELAITAEKRVRAGLVAALCGRDAGGIRVDEGRPTVEMKGYSVPINDIPAEQVS